ncbi:hypothetical protein D917_10184 [Trichinella nativa]|uniref:Uncharacterized protein n=1 Tax=Trichinella nativa TaxID=6335 RepID=A0A1Y3ECZ6_9BILA|nr:hypothetical protein D917_10184 [Trichinella nativa]
MTNSSHETSNIERQRGSVMRFIDSRSGFASTKQ